MIRFTLNGIEPDLAIQALEDAMRTSRAVQIPTCDIQPKGPGLYLVKSQSRQGFYAVNLIAKTCTCKDLEYRQAECKHQKSARLYEETGPRECQYNSKFCQGCMLARFCASDQKRRQGGC